jgi:hypothetical protein
MPFSRDWVWMCFSASLYVSVSSPLVETMSFRTSCLGESCYLVDEKGSKELNSPDLI